MLGKIMKRYSVEITLLLIDKQALSTRRITTITPLARLRERGWGRGKKWLKMKSKHPASRTAGSGSGFKRTGITGHIKTVGNIFYTKTKF